MNSEADYASRNFNNHTEWMLDPIIFQQITTRYYTPEVDLFATRLNHQVPQYVARYPDPGALATDALSQGNHKSGKVCTFRTKFKDKLANLVYSERVIVL